MRRVGRRDVSVRARRNPSVVPMPMPMTTNGTRDGGGFAALAPPGVVVVETARPHAWEDEPGLEPDTGGLAGGRVREFRIGRACARRALGQLGLPEVSVPAGTEREPIWPPGIVGSITHSEGYAAAAVARAADVLGLGIDVERHVALAPGVIRRVCTPGEQVWLDRAPDDGRHWPVIVFSAKESIYKAWYPKTGRWLGFQDVELELDAARGTFRADLPEGLRVHGWFGTTAEHVFTLAVLDAEHVVTPTTLDAEQPSARRPANRLPLMPQGVDDPP